MERAPSRMFDLEPSTHTAALILFQGKYSQINLK